MKLSLLCCLVTCFGGLVSATPQGNAAVVVDPPQPECKTACNRIYRPVCSVRWYRNRLQFSSFSNECILDVYNCQHKANIFYGFGPLGNSCSELYLPETSVQ